MSRARVASALGLHQRSVKLDPQPHRDVPERQAQYHHSLQRRVESVMGKTNEQAAVNGEKRTERRKQAAKRVIHISGKLACQRCGNGWIVVDLNPERKVVKCPICNIPNDIKTQSRGQHERTEERSFSPSVRENLQQRRRGQSLSSRGTPITVVRSEQRPSTTDTSGSGVLLQCREIRSACTPRRSRWHENQVDDSRLRSSRQGYCCGDSTRQSQTHVRIVFFRSRREGDGCRFSQRRVSRTQVWTSVMPTA